MGRALKGSAWEQGGRFYASLPARRGARQRVQGSFDREVDRDAWRAAGVAALKAGRQLAPAEAFDSASLNDEPRLETSTLPNFEQLAYGWLDEYYGRLRRGNAERERAARQKVEDFLIPAFAGPIPADASAARARLIAFVRRMAAEPEWCNDTAGGLPQPDENLTVAEAASRCQRSVATIRRALRGGRLPRARRSAEGHWLIPAGDLAAARIGTAAPMQRVVGRRYATDLLWLHRKILEWGRANGHAIPVFERDVNALEPDESVARKRGDAKLRRPLSFGEIARVAVHLHVVHQLVLWLMRVLGLRISEAYGLRVGDIIDLGEFGLAVVDEQGGRAFVTRTRTGVVTGYSKKALKRAASHRVIVVPSTLMALLRVVVEAFHTDPDTGEVDLDARLVPWVIREGGNQSSFRSALDAGLRLEGFDLESCGFEVTTHDLRKSLATDLAWEPELDELAKRRVLGHKAGDDVFARVYTLDHPTLAPLLNIATAVQALIEATLPSLLVATERRVHWAHANPLRRRVAHIDAVLAEAGWQVAPGGEDNPWCDTAQVAAELGVGPTTARRWMRDQLVPSTTSVDAAGSRERRARLRDVLAVKEQLASRKLLRDFAIDLGIGYHRAYNTMRRLGIDPHRDPRTDELLLNPDQEQSLRDEFDRVARLMDRSMRLSDAAVAMGVDVSYVKRFIREGLLTEDNERDAFGARYVRRDSVTSLVDKRLGRSRRPHSDLLPVETVATLTGLSPVQVRELADRGLLQRSDVRRRFHITFESLVRWATGFRPDLLVALGEAAECEAVAGGTG